MWPARTRWTSSSAATRTSSSSGPSSRRSSIPTTSSSTRRTCCARRTRARWRAPTTVHQGAIYLHGGRSYEVEAFSPEDGRAFVSDFSGDWYTQPKRDTDTLIEQVLATRTALGVNLSFGTVVVTEQVLAYQRRR